MATETYTIKSLTRPRITTTIYYDLTGGTDGTTVFLGFDSTFHTVGDEMAFQSSLAQYVVFSFDTGQTLNPIYRVIKFNDYTGLEQEWNDGTSALILQYAMEAKMAKYELNASRPDTTSASRASFYQETSLVGNPVSFTKL